MKSLPIHSKHYLELHKEFEAAIIAQGFSGKKKAPYGSLIREFLFYLEENRVFDIKAVKAKDIIGFYEYIKERPNQNREGTLSDTMIRHHLYTVRLFFDHLLSTERITSSPARIPRFMTGQRKERYVLTIDEIKSLYKAADKKIERAILAFAYGCGLRRNEIMNLNVSDVIFSKGIVNVRDGKNHKSRTVPMSDMVIKDLREYLIYGREEKINPNIPPPQAFLLNRDGERMGNQMINKYIKWLVNKVEDKSMREKGISLHCLRHSIATHLLDNGAEIDFVRRFLGHELLDTTHLYSKRRKQQHILTKQYRVA